MPADLPIAEVLQVTGITGLLVLMFWLLATGRLVTRREADDIRADRDVWRSTCLEQKGLLSAVLTGQETTNRLLRALPLAHDATDEEP